MSWTLPLLLATALAAQDGDLARKLADARELKQRGAAAEALKAYEAILPQLRAAGDRKLLAQALLGAGQSALAAGDYPRALQRGDEAGALFRAQHDLANEASAANLAGSAQIYRGDYPAALEHFYRALDLDRQQHDVHGEINRLNNIANAYFFQGRYLDALENYETELRRVEENPREPWSASRRQLALTNLAILYQQLGQYQKALDYYKQALSGQSALSPAEHGQLLSNAGTLYRRLGDAVKALENYREAQKLFAHGHLSDAEIGVLQNVGIALALDLHDPLGATQAFSDALQKAEATNNRREVVLAHLFRGESYFRESRWQQARLDFNAALEGARAIGAIEEQWTALFGVARIQRREDPAQALATLREAIANIESVRTGLGASSLKADFLANKRDVYDAVIDLMLDAPSPDFESLFSLFEQAKARNLQDAVRGSTGTPSLKAVQGRLSQGSVLLEYWTGAGHLAVLWATRDSAGISRGQSLEPAVRSLAAALRSGDPAWRAHAAKVSAGLLQDVPGVDGARHLLIVPDGALYLIPFEALPLKSGRLAIEQAAVSYLPSAALLLRDAPRTTWLMPWHRQLLALGDPLVEGRTALAGDERWARLPHAAAELHSVAAALPGRASIFSGENDQKRFLTRSPLIHLATHAVADPVDATRSRMLFTPEPGRKGSEYLFRGEIQGSAFEGAELVTLSACDTESGPLARGEGVQSFSRAFLAAGARSTVTTLWRVEDTTTAGFMQIFYQRLAGGQAKAEALRAAKLSFLLQGGQRAQPLYWAAFVLNGDGQEPIRRVLAWWWFALALLAAVAMITAYRFFRRRRHRLQKA